MERTRHSVDKETQPFGRFINKRRQQTTERGKRCQTRGVDEGSAQSCRLSGDAAIRDSTPAMPPRKAKGKKNATEAQPRRSTRGGAKAEPEPEPEHVETPVSNEELEAALPPSTSQVAAAVDSVLSSAPPPEPSPEPIEEDQPEQIVQPSAADDVEMDATGAVTVVPVAETEPAAASSGMTREQRMAKLEELRLKMVCYKHLRHSVFVLIKIT